MRTEGEKIFQISWDGGGIIYHPASHFIQNIVTGKTSRLFGNHSIDCTDIPGDQKFKPFCLTLYLSHRCNLACRYCYVQDKHALPTGEIEMPAVQAAAEIVARNCIELGMPFILGFHGGNEPLLHPELIEQSIAICRKIATQHGLELVTTCTTNGVISNETAEWAAKTFYAITLSWDGPPEIHDRFRVHAEGSPTSATVSRTAKIFLNPANGLRQFRVRSTITSESVDRISEMVKFFHQQNVKWIEFYPVYQDLAKTIPNGWLPEPTRFVAQFLAARRWARQHGMMFGYAGSRVSDFHGQHCPVNQHNLTITPDGFLTACFLATHDHHSQNDSTIYGHYDRKQKQWIIKQSRLDGIFQSLHDSSVRCEDCFNHWHCAKGCPAVCPLKANMDPYDCRIEKWIGLANILEAGGVELSETDMADCESYFSNIDIRMIEEERVRAAL